MNLPQITHTNVSEYLDRDSIVRRTAEQIMKDFSLFGVTITFSGDVSHAYDELFNQLVEQITELISVNYSKLLSVLYQVDISDREIRRAHSELPDYNDTEIIAHQIIVRELKKVMTYEYFKSQK